MMGTRRKNLENNTCEISRLCSQTARNFFRSLSIWVLFCITTTTIVISHKKLSWVSVAEKNFVFTILARRLPETSFHIHFWLWWSLWRCEYLVSQPHVLASPTIRLREFIEALIRVIPFAQSIIDSVDRDYLKNNDRQQFKELLLLVIRSKTFKSFILNFFSCVECSTIDNNIVDTTSYVKEVFLLLVFFVWEQSDCSQAIINEIKLLSSVGVFKVRSLLAGKF